MKTILIVAAGLAATGLSAAPVDWSKLPPAAAVTGVTFDKDIAPLLKASCVRCHSGDRPRGRLRLDSLDDVLKGSKDGPVVIAGDSANSLIVKAVSQLDPQTAMPPKPRGQRPMGTNAPFMAPPNGGPGAGGPPPDGPGGPPPLTGPGGQPPMEGPGGPPPGREAGAPGTNGPGQFPPRLRPMGPPPKPLTAEQVGLVRAWIDQGAK
ncbi:MAG TPA: c-type cytochrome domain-containing protein [Candidatus Acidoferrales bacterium]|nr:c-type cytochrome domain-containing protein [Candidatus Acidoferrales bacterium]